MLDTRRHDALFDRKSFDLPIHIVGVGGVGSHVAYLLAKLGVGNQSPVTVYDGDKVEPHNLANQAYSDQHVGLYKAEALYDQYRLWSGGVEIWPVTKFITEPVAFSGVVFLCLDNMEARKQICESSLWGNDQVKLLVETRTSVTDVMIFALDPASKRHTECWDAYWYPSTQADNDIGCSGPMSIVTAVSLTAGFAVDTFLRFADSRKLNRIYNRFCYNLARKEQIEEQWE